MEIKKLTPSEVTSLWNSYLTNTMTMWVTPLFTAKTQDKELHSILEYAEEIATIEVQKSKQFLEEAGFPLPHKFDNDDVDIHAPALFTDNFVLLIKYNLAQVALVVYSMSQSTSTRKDIREFYQKCIRNVSVLYNRLADLMIKKGLHHPEIHMPVPNKVEKIRKQSYLAGWLANRRPLNSDEVSQLVYNFKSTELNKTFLKGFAQVSPSNELKKHFLRGAEMLQKHLDIFQSILSENDLPKLPTWESEITDSTVAPFSERLMLYKMTLLASECSGRYASALSTVLRRDLGAHYMRLMTEVLQYGEDSLNIMIERGFIDELPMAKENPAKPSTN